VSLHQWDQDCCRYLLYMFDFFLYHSVCLASGAKFFSLIEISAISLSFSFTVTLHYFAYWSFLHSCWIILIAFTRVSCVEVKLHSSQFCCTLHMYTILVFASRSSVLLLLVLSRVLVDIRRNCVICSTCCCLGCILCIISYVVCQGNESIDFHFLVW